MATIDDVNSKLGDLSTSVDTLVTDVTALKASGTDPAKLQQAADTIDALKGKVDQLDAALKA